MLQAEGLGQRSSPPAETAGKDGGIETLEQALEGVVRGGEDLLGLGINGELAVLLQPQTSFAGKHGDGVRIVRPGDGGRQGDKDQVEEAVGGAADPARVVEVGKETEEAQGADGGAGGRGHPCRSLGSWGTPTCRNPTRFTLTSSTSTGQDTHSGKRSPW